MPTVLRKSGYRFHFYSHEGTEPPHIHVARDDAEAKFWLAPVRLADNEGFSAHEVQRIFLLVNDHCQYLRARYTETHGSRARHRREEGGR